MATYEFRTVKKSIELSDVYIVNLLKRMNLMNHKDDIYFFDNTDYNAAKDALTDFLKSLGYADVYWSE